MNPISFTISTFGGIKFVVSGVNPDTTRISRTIDVMIDTLSKFYEGIEPSDIILIVGTTLYSRGHYQNTTHVGRKRTWGRIGVREVESVIQSSVPSEHRDPAHSYTRSRWIVPPVYMIIRDRQLTKEFFNRRIEFNMTDVNMTSV
jgi:hypothetical protein